MYLTFPETIVIGLHFAADSLGLPSFMSFVVGSKRRIFSATKRLSAIQG